MRIQLTNVPATPEYPYHFKEVIENVQKVLDSTRFIEDYSEIFLTTNDDSWIFNQCRFDVEKAMIDAIYTAVYATNNLIDNIIDYKDRTKIEASGKYNLSNFLKSFGKDDPMNEQFFYYM